MYMEISELVRDNIRRLKPYSSARNEFKGEASVFLDANENPMNTPYNRYPDPLQQSLKAKIAALKHVRPAQIMLGVGSDEPIDLAIRIFCEPTHDNIVAIEPTYGMYRVCADINNVEYRQVLLNQDYTFNAEHLLAATDAHTKLIFLCSPNNPTGNLLRRNEITKILTVFKGIVVIDEAYIDFSSEKSWLTELDNFPNIIVLQTFSKAWGMASVRCGMAFASEEIISYFNKVKYPYNLNLLTQNFVNEQLNYENRTREWVAMLVSQRSELAKQLVTLPMVEKIYPSDANFLLVKVPDANVLYNQLVERGIVVRNRNNISLCLGCLRITVGTKAENEVLLNALREIGGVETRDHLMDEGNFTAADNSAETQKGNNLATDAFDEKQNGVIACEDQSLEKIVKTFADERKAIVRRTTKETDIFISLDLDGTGKTDISTGIGFFDHLLDQIGRHSGMDLTVNAKGDLYIDEHHTIEDTAIALGEALLKALGSKRGIERYGFCLPMDDCLCSVAIDFGGRAWLVFDASFNREKIGDMPTEMIMHFFKSLSDAAKMNLNIKAEGENEHHKAEGIFKALARSIKMAVKRDPNNNELPSTKGLL
jgi:histidinol-phosphate aminotransferase